MDKSNKYFLIVVFAIFLYAMFAIFYSVYLGPSQLNQFCIDNGFHESVTDYSGISRCISEKGISDLSVDCTINYPLAFFQMFTLQKMDYKCFWLKEVIVNGND